MFASKKFLLSRQTLYSTYFRTAGAVVLRIAYGYEIKENDILLVRFSDQALSDFPLPRKRHESRSLHYGPGFCS